MSNIIALSTGKAPDNTNLLEVLDVLRQRVEDGSVIAFAAVTISPTDETHGYSAAHAGVTRLRMGGAIANLNHAYQGGALDEG